MNYCAFQSHFRKAILIQKLVVKTLNSLFVVLLVISFLTAEFSELKLLESNRGSQIQHLAKRNVSCLFTNVSKEVLHIPSLVTRKVKQSHYSVLHVIHFAPFR